MNFVKNFTPRTVATGYLFLCGVKKNGMRSMGRMSHRFPESTERQTSFLKQIYFKSTRIAHSRNGNID